MGRRSILKTNTDETCQNDDTMGDGVDMGEGGSDGKKRRRVSFNSSMYVRPIAKNCDVKLLESGDAADGDCDECILGNDYQAPTYLKSIEEDSNDSISKIKSCVAGPSFVTALENSNRSHSLLAESAETVLNITPKSHQLSSSILNSSLPELTTSFNLNLSVEGIAKGPKIVLGKSFSPPEVDSIDISSDWLDHNAGRTGDNKRMTTITEDFHSMLSFVSKPSHSSVSNNQPLSQCKYVQNLTDHLEYQQDISAIMNSDDGCKVETIAAKTQLDESEKKKKDLVCLETDNISALFDSDNSLLTTPPQKATSALVEDKTPSSASKGIQADIQGRISQAIFQLPRPNQSAEKQQLSSSKNATVNLPRKKMQKKMSFAQAADANEGHNPVAVICSKDTKFTDPPLNSAEPTATDSGAKDVNVALDDHQSAFTECHEVKADRVSREKSHKVSTKTLQTPPNELRKMVEIDDYLNFNQEQLLDSLRQIVEVVCLAEIESTSASQFKDLFLSLDSNGSKLVEDAEKKYKLCQDLEKMLSDKEQTRQKGRFVSSAFFFTKKIDSIWLNSSRIEAVYDKTLKLNFGVDEESLRCTDDFSVTQLLFGEECGYLQKSLDLVLEHLLIPGRYLGQPAANCLSFALLLIDEGLIPKLESKKASANSEIGCGSIN